MAWTTWPTAVTGAVATAAEENTKRDDANLLNAVLLGTDDRLVPPTAWGERGNGAAQYVNLPASSTVVYTVPASTIAIVRKVICANRNATSTTFVVSAAVRYVTSGLIVPGYDYREIDGWWVMAAGETVSAIGGGSGTDIVLEVYEVPSAVTGYVPVRASGSNPGTAGTYTLYTAPAAPKQSTVRCITIHNGATAQTLILWRYPADVAAFAIRQVAAGEVWIWTGSLPVPAGRMVSIGIAGATAIADWTVDALESDN